MRSHPSLAYGQPMSEHAARRLLNGGRAASHARTSTIPTAHPAHPIASSPVTPGFVRIPHRGAWPTTVSCVCDCHGNGDASGRSCDVASCVDV